MLKLTFIESIKLQLSFVYFNKLNIKVNVKSLSLLYIPVGFTHINLDGWGGRQGEVGQALVLPCEILYFL